MLDVGRDATITDKIGDIQTILLRYAKSGDAKFNEKAGQVGWEMVGNGGQNGEFIASKITELKSLIAQRDQGDAAAASVANKSLATQAVEQSDTQASMYDTKEQKRTKEILAAYNKANADIEKQMAVGDTASAERIAQNYVKTNEGITAKYAVKAHKARAGGSKSDPFASLDNLVQGAQVKDNNFGIEDKQTQQVAAIEKVVDAGAKLIASGHDLAKVQALVASGVTSINDLYAKEADQLRQKNIAQVKAYTESLHDQLATRQQLLDLQVSAVGMGAKEAQQQQQLLAIDQQYNRQKASLLRQQNNSTSAIQREFFQQELDALDASHEAERQSTKDHWAKMDAAQAIGLNGMKSAINDFLDRERDMAAQTKQFTTSFIDGFGNAFASFIDGTASAKKAFGGFIDSMYQQAVKFLADKTIQALFDSFGGGAKQTAGTTAGGFASFFGNLGNDLGLAGSFGPGTIGAGLALGGPVAPGSLHPVNEDGPEIYTTGGKTYLMAGAEPGRVTPLSSGKAGVTVNQTIVVSGLVNRQTRSQLAQQTAQRQRIAMARNG
jgi:lambda family phage tail tape measure protein